MGMESRLLTGEREEAAFQQDGGLLLERCALVLASTPESGDYMSNGIWGATLAGKLAGPGGRAGHFIMDVRDRVAFSRGHIEGAHHVELKEWASRDSLRRLPHDRKIIVVCDIGNTGPQVVAGLRLLGYDAAVLRTGMNGWARNGLSEEVEADISASYPVENTPPDSYIPPPPDAPFSVPAEGEREKVLRALRELFAAMPTEGDYAFNLVHPAYVHQLVGGGERDGVFFLDVRREEDYEGVGHIPGAVQADFRAALTSANLERLPRDRKIITVCYTGNTAAQLVTMLRLIGFDAMAMKYGMMGWKMTPTTYAYKKDLARASNPVVTG